jgi:hypothetical protein
VVVCPKKSTSIIRLNETEKQLPFPYYERLCKNYGFSIEVEIIHSTDNAAAGQSLKKSGGPKMTHYLKNTSNNTATVAKLHHCNERLIIRPLNASSSSSKKNSKDLLLRPDFQNGDVITSMDGKSNPTFAMIYAVMMRGDKLLLEIERRQKSGRKRSSDSGRIDLQDTATAGAAENTVSTETATTTSSKQKRQVSAWDAENRRVQREQKKLQREQEKEERLRQQQQQQQQQLVNDEMNGTNAAKTASSDTATLAATASKKQSKATKSTTSTTNNTSTNKTTLNIHSPNYITKAVARLEQNVQEFNRQQKDEEEAMYGEGKRMLLDYTLADHGDDSNTTIDDEKKCEDDAVEKDEGIDGEEDTAPTAALTFDDNDVGGSVGVGDDSFSPDHPPPLEESSSPMQQTSLDDDAGKNDDSSSSSSSVPSSSSSGSSSSSVPSSSSSSSSVPSSSSDSDSSSSSSNNDCNTSKSIQPPRTITTSASASINPMSATSVPAISTATANQPAIKRPRSSSSISNDGIGRTYPTYSSTMSYPSRNNTTKPGLNNEPPTSLGRLWPDPSDIVKALTRLQPPSATVKQRHVEFYGEVGVSGEEGRGVGKLSLANPLIDATTTTTTAATTTSKQYNEFKNANEMMECLARPLMDEGRASINNDYHSTKFRNGRWNRDTHRLVVMKVTPVTPIFEKKSSFFGDNIKMYEIQFSLKGETTIPPSNLSELYCLHYHRWKGCKFGIVGHDFPTTITFRSQSESNSMLKLFVCVDGSLTDDASERSKTGWLSKNEFRALFDPHKFGVLNSNVVLTLMSVGSTTNIVRQFEAIASIGYLKCELHLLFYVMSRYISFLKFVTHHSLRFNTTCQHIFKRRCSHPVSKSSRNLQQQQQQ